MIFRKALNAAALATTLLFAACSTARPGVVVTNCVSDPPTESLQCVDHNGWDLVVPWKDSANFVCRPADDDQVLNEAAHAK